MRRPNTARVLRLKTMAAIAMAGFAVMTSSLAVSAVNPSTTGPHTYAGCTYSGYTLKGSSAFSQTGQPPYAYCPDWMIVNGYFWNGSSYVNRSSGWVDGTAYAAANTPYFGSSDYVYGDHQIMVAGLMSPTKSTFAS